MKLPFKKLVEQENSELDKATACHIIGESGLFDESWYMRNLSLKELDNLTPLEHYYAIGFLDGTAPSYLFHPKWYLEKYPDVAEAKIEPLLHYILHGEKEGRQPSVYFDPKHYIESAGLESDSAALRDYYENATKPVGSPLPEFDPTYYLNEYDDIHAAQIDPYNHFLLNGYNEGRKPNNDVDFENYRQVFLGGNEDTNVFYHYLSEGKELGYQLNKAISDSSLETTSFLKQEQHFLAANSSFEEFKYGERRRDPDVKAIAYYLPQFHPLKENNEWWGTGFTEWTNVTRGRSRFVGHYQPRLPRDLGYYDLRLKETLVRQAEMARSAGLEGFCFYHYSFNGKRLMEGPTNLLLESPEIELPFCLMWANENWTRTWDGFDEDILLAQNYAEEDDASFIEDLVRHFEDPRYIRLDSRPLFFIYRPGIIPEAQKKFKKWRQILEQEHGIEPLFYMAQAFDDLDPRKYGLDGAIEFPPHKVAKDLPSVAQEAGLLDSNFTGHYPSYSSMIEKSLDDQEFDYDVIKAVTPSWDNEARKPAKGMGFVGSTPEKYQYWLDNVCSFARRNPIQNKHKFVAINAWNEWAEGAYLEPDMHWGSAYLNATYQALHRIQDNQDKYSVLLIGHDAYKHGAQLLTLNIFRTLKQQFGVNVKLIILDEGPLVKEYEEIGETFVCKGNLGLFAKTIERLRDEHGFRSAICNTVVTGKIAPILNQQGYKFISLIHELGTLIEDYGLAKEAKNISIHADRILFAANAVKESFQCVVEDSPDEKLYIQPQGIYQKLLSQPDAKQKVRESLGLNADAKLVVNAGYADLRKGFDLFLNTAKLLAAKDSNFHFVWIGSIDQQLLQWLGSDMQSQPLKSNFHVVPFSNSIADLLSASDVFAMSSREDPFPSVVLEALAMGKPVVGFDGGGGFTELLDNSDHGETVPMTDIVAFANAIENQAALDTKTKQQIRAKFANDGFQWDRYVFSLLQHLDEDLKPVSVVIPNYNYAHHLEERLRSIINQSYPIFELLFLDDNSSDDSVELTQHILAAHQRSIRIIRNDINSGSVFKQWQKGANIARGEFLWIAEADDSASDCFLQAMLEQTQEFTAAYSDSVQIDENDKRLAENYRYYYDSDMQELLDRPGIYPGSEGIEKCLSVKNQFMNVSAMLFDAQEVRECINENLDAILRYRVAGDYHIYVALLSKPGATLKLLTKSLNIHRRHSSSVTHTTLDLQSEEISSVHKLLSNILSTDKIDAQQEYLSSLFQEESA